MNFRAGCLKPEQHIRDTENLENAVCESRRQWETLNSQGCSFEGVIEMSRAFTVRQLCFAQLVYLESIRSAVGSGVGSRGSALVTSHDGEKAHPDLGNEWKFASEKPDYRDKVLETVANPDGNITSSWQARNDVPVPDAWFETAWAEYRKGEIYK